MALGTMGSSMSVVVQQIYDVMDLCNDGQLRKLSAQGAGQDSAGAEANAVTTMSGQQPTGHRSVLSCYVNSDVQHFYLHRVIMCSLGVCMCVHVCLHVHS